MKIYAANEPLHEICFSGVITCGAYNMNRPIGINRILLHTGVGGIFYKMTRDKNDGQEKAVKKMPYKEIGDDNLIIYMEHEYGYDEQVRIVDYFKHNKFEIKPDR